MIFPDRLSKDHDDVHVTGPSSRRRSHADGELVPLLVHMDRSSDLYQTEHVSASVLIRFHLSVSVPSADVESNTDHLSVSKTT